MEKVVARMLTILLASCILTLNGCRPPLIERTIGNINDKEYTEAYRTAEEAIERNPENAEAWFYWGLLNGKYKRDYETMNQAFSRSMELNPEQKVYYRKNRQEIKDAVSHFRDSTYALIYNKKILVLRKDPESINQSELLNARKAFQEAKQIAPNRVETYFPLALTNIFLGDTAKAKMVIEEGLQRYPNNEKLLNEASDLYTRIKDTTRAEQLLQQLLKINPDKGEAYRLLGQLEASRKNWEKAKSYFQRAIELTPGDGSLVYNIGVSYYNQQQYKEAIPYFQKSLKVEPDNVQTYEVLGICYVQTGMEKEGIRFLEGAVKKYPKEASLWEYLAILYGKQKMSKQADHAFKKAKSLKDRK